MDGVRIVTYNTQCRSWGMEAGAQGTLTPATSAEQRARSISQRILDSPQQYDVVCLNEVFDEDARDVFEGALLPSYPHAVLKADAGSPGAGMLKLAAAAVVNQVPVAGWLDAFGLSAGVLSDLRALEDSGLMLFSRLPFDTVPPPAGFEGLLSGDFPVVAYAPYAYGADSDAFAAKGVVYARLLRPGGDPLHLLMSHTQADPTAEIGKFSHIRARQFEQVAELASTMAGGWPFAEEMLFCGDLNVNGMRDPNGARPEWRDLFDTPGSFLTSGLHDVWVHEQRPQDLQNPGTPLPVEDPGMTTHLQRLDYMLRPPEPAFAGRLATQHVAIAYDLAQGTQATTYTSDHLPLRIDLNLPQDHNTVWTAEPITRAQISPDFRSPHTLLMDGEMHWYRIDEPGGYGFALDGEPRAGFEVYTADNFSMPMQPFTQVAEPVDADSPPLTRFALPAAPFFIRVFDHERTGKTSYRLYVHRYEGRGPGDAIPLLHGVPTPGEAQSGTPHSLNRPETPFDDTDCVWFLSTFDDPPPGRDAIRSTVSVFGMDQPAFGVIAVARDPNGDLFSLDEESSGSDPVRLSFDHRDRGRGYLLVRRADPDFAAQWFTIELTSEVTYIYTLPVDRDQPGDERRHGLDQAYLFCEDETDGLFGSESGSDDIAINVSSQGTLLLHVDHNDDLEFDDDTKRDLTFPLVRWAGDVKLELVELDDFSAADRASIVLPQLPDAERRAEQILRRNGTAIFGPFPIDFGDGRYHIALTLSQQPPPVD
jgi:endonuclease/exonuclease/phosphatase family metal-dependent hydrolase